MSEFASRTTEDEMAAMGAWWRRNCKPFSEWFLKLEDAARLALIQKGCPDIPKLNAQAREKSGESLKATDVLLPELTEDALMAADGKICVLFLTRRCTSLCVDSDLKLLYDLEIKKQLPRFNLGKNTAELDKIDTPFIDPSDPDENIRSLGPQTSLEMRSEVNAGFAVGRFATINSWLGVKIRRTAIAQFIKVLMEEFEGQNDETWKPKPLLSQLLDAELKMKAAGADATEAANASGLEQLS